MKLRLALTLVVFGAALVLSPSCGDDLEERTQVLRARLRAEVEGTWTLTLASGERALVTLKTPADATLPLVGSGFCASRAPALVARAWACVNMEELSLTGTATSDGERVKGQVSGKAWMIEGGTTATVELTVGSTRLSGTVGNGQWTQGNATDAGGGDLGAVTGSR